MKVKIVTESVSDLTPEIASELGITVVPLYIQFGTETYRDRIDLTPEEFYFKLAHAKTLPTTATPSPAIFAETYDRLAEETDEILVITLTSKLGAEYEVALQARKLMKRKCRVEVIDSLLAVMAEGLVIIAAAKAANSGANLDEVMNITHRNIRCIGFRGTFPSLEYLARGGRIGKAQALLGSMLKVNPIVTLKDGVVVPAGRERSRAKAIEHLYNFAISYRYIEEMAVEEGACPDEAETLVDRLSPKFPKERIYRVKASPVVGTHTGPGLLIVSVLGDKG